MSFATGYLLDPSHVGSGERFGDHNIIFSHATFEDGLTQGRFAKLDTGSLDNMDASATPTIAGVVLRNVAGAADFPATYTTDLFTSAPFLRQGLVTVDVKAGQTPTQFGPVYAYNIAGADVGKAVAVATDAVEINAEFLEEVKPNVWLIRMLGGNA